MRILVSYSRLISILKIFAAATSVALIFSIFILPQITLHRSNLTEVSNLARSQSSNRTLKNSVHFDTTTDGKQIKITAETIFPNQENGKNTTLHNVTAEVFNSPENKDMITSDTAVLKHDNNQIEFIGNVHFVDDFGHEITSDKLYTNGSSTSAIFQENVFLTFGPNNMTAKKLEIFRKQKSDPVKMKLTGGVKLRYYPSNQ